MKSKCNCLSKRSSRFYLSLPVCILLLVAAKIQFGALTRELQDVEPASVAIVAADQGVVSRTQKKPMVFRPEDYPPPPPSVYTNRTGQPLPDWARKYFFLPQPNKTAGDKSLCFVHVGKTAGTTIACYLGFQYRGEETFALPRGRLRDNTVHAFHNWVNDCPDDDDYYLFATRDPISRMQSWFTYERPHWNWGQGPEWLQQKKLFLDCPFPHLNDLAEKGLGDPAVHPEANAICRRRAYDAVRGYQIFYRHNYYNYQWYLRHVPKDKPFLALRQEYLAQDWMSAEAVLANDAKDVRPQVNITFPHRNRSFNVSEADRKLSADATKNLCRVLCMEIQAYKEILSRSVNLSPQDYEASMKMLAEHCPKGVKEPTCDPRIFEKQKNGGV